MKLFAILSLAILGNIAHAAPLTVSEAIPLACAEAYRADFSFESTCEEEFVRPFVSGNFYQFTAFDAGTACDLTVVVNRLTGQTSSGLNCGESDSE